MKKGSQYFKTAVASAATSTVRAELSVQPEIMYKSQRLVYPVAHQPTRDVVGMWSFQDGMKRDLTSSTEMLELNKEARATR